MNRITPSPSLPRPSTRRPPIARRAPAALVLALALLAAGVFTPHAPAATPDAQAQAQTQAQAPAQVQPQADETKADQEKPYLQMRRNARARVNDRRSARAGRAGAGLSADERMAKIVDNAWWNDPELTERAHLSETLRRKMDDLLRDNLAGRRKALDATRDAQKAFYTALEAGDPKAAASHLDAVDQAQASIVRSQLELRLAVARLLTPDQRTALTQTRPRLWRERWVRLEPRANTARRGRGGATTEDGAGS